MSRRLHAEKDTGDVRVAATAPQPAGSGTGPRALSPEAVQYWIDRAAHFNMFSTPNQPGSDPAILAPGDPHTVIGLRIDEVLHRFDVLTKPSTAQAPISARNIVGEPAGKFTHRWLVMPDGFVASPCQEPPPTVFDPSRSQRFVMLDRICTFGDGEDSFRGFGTGQTLPVVVNGQLQLLVTAIGTIIEGFGKFKDHEEGTYVYCGKLAPQCGFTGNVLLRVMDREEVLHTENALPNLQPQANPEPEITYILFRGQAVPADPVTPKLGADGRPNGLIVEQGLRLLGVDCKAGGHSGLQSTARVGPLIGRITAYVAFDPSAPGGSVSDPIPFTSYDEFVLFDDRGERIGTFTANSAEGRVFKTQIAGQPGIRFGGTGQILKGTGPFEGIRGLMTDNSVVVFTPHVSASLYMLRLHDPGGKFRAAVTRCHAEER
jgi:hypothetical protein